MPRTLRGTLVRAIHILVIVSMVLGLCTPAMRPTRVVAAGPVAVAGVGEAQPVAEPPETRPSVGLEVTVDPPQAKPGELVTVIVRVKAQEALSEATLAATLAPGLSFEGAEGEGARFEAGERKLQWALGRVEGGERVWRCRLRVQDDARDVTQQEFALQGPGDQGTLAMAQAVVKRPFPPAEARVTPEEGGELRSADGRVRVVFPKGAVEGPVRVEHRPKRADAMLAQQPGMALEFELNAFTGDGAAAPVRKFAKPLELRVDLSGLIDLQALPMYQYARLAYWDEAKGGWADIRAWREGNTLIGTLDHFCTLGSGTGNIYSSGWLLAFNDANVATFSGALTYDYPIQVPAGRGGLTPDLRLSYNSRRTDGLLTWIQTDWVGLGWTLDTMEIVRKIEPSYDASSGSPAWCWGWFGYSHEYTLLYNGTSYKLKAGTGNAYGRYYTEDEQFLYIERRNSVGQNGSPANETSEYWIVRLRDGTEYRLGYNRDSEQVIWSNYYTPEFAQGGCTWNDGKAPTSGTCYFGQLSGHVAFRQDGFLQRIKVQSWNAGQYATVREYVLGYSKRIFDCGGAHCNNTRLLTSIREYGQGGASLPATTLAYTAYANKGICHAFWGGACTDGEHDSWDQESFGYERLTRVDNGYGGVITASYETPDAGWWQAYNYRVAQKTVTATSGGYVSTYSYPTAVSDRCYVTASAPYTCQPFAPDAQTGGSLAGYRWVDEALKTPGGTAVATTSHEFWLTSGDMRLGRESAATRKDAASAALEKVATAWATEASAGGTTFIYAQSVQEYMRVGSALPASPQRETSYEYSTALQGGSQYGNPTRVKEYQAGSLYRQAETTYYPNVSLWIVDRPALAVLKDGAGSALAKSRSIYDGNTSYNQAPTRGDGTKVEQTRAVNPADDWLTVQTTTYDPATFYLPTQVTDANSHSTQTAYDPTWKLYPVTVTNAKGHVTTYGYDYARGLITNVTGTNGAATNVLYQYDAFGRLKAAYRPGDTAQSTITYDYCDSCSPLRIITYERAVVNQPAAVPTVRYYNGLGQLIQEHHSTIDTQQTRITNHTYNAQGLQQYAYVAYTIATPDAYQWQNYLALDTTQPKAVYTYDALGRVTTITNPDATTVRSFYAGLADGMETTVVDENGHQKASKADAFGRLAEVREYSGTYPSASLYATTRYEYNPLDLLTGVIDAANNQTTINYDALGRKTGMTDPDMGAWSYAYDPVGNLLRQTDAKGMSTFFAYDALNRLTGKQYAGSTSYPDPFVPTITYSYDDTSGGNLGRGYRTGMSDPSGSTAWRYDARGRLVQESKTVTGAGTFVTQWAYNSRDLVEAQTYPGGSGGQLGEVVSTDYWPWGVANSTSGASPYVVDTPLTGDGRTDLVKLGGTAASPTLQIDYAYYPWTTANGRGRLQSIKAGPPASPTALQNLTYTYDPAGNVATIQDMKDVTPLLSFSYDHLDRLTGASGAYADQWSYDQLGNLTGKSGTAAYTYDAQQVHAVRSVIGIAQPVTQTVTIWARGVTTDGVEPQMVLRVNGTACLTATVQAGSVYRPYSAQVPLTGQDIFEVCYTNDNAARELWVDAVNVGGDAPLETPYHAYLPAVRHTTTGTPAPTPSPTPLPGQGITVQAEGGAMLYGKGSFEAPNVVPGQERLDEGGALRFVVGQGAYAAEYDANGNMTSRAVDGQAQVLEWDAENRLVKVTQDSSVSEYVYDGDGNRVKATQNGTATVYVGNYYEQTGSTIRTYYYHNGQRVAMREGGVTTWLLGDHLGSTSVAYRASDGQTTAQRYYAWGTIRPGPANALPTDYAFTGQRLDTQSNLYHMGARWYDGAVGRWLSPDTIVPVPGNPQDLNRFTYARNNPVAYIDPSGHVINLAAAGIGALVGAAFGAGATALPQMIRNVREGQPLTANIDPAEVGKNALIGAGAGLVGGLTFGVGLAASGAAAGALGITSASGTAATAAGVATIAVSGAAAGQTSRLTANVLRGDDPTAGLLRPQDMATDAALSLVGFKVFGGEFSKIAPAAPELAQELPEFIYRQGDTSPSNLTPRAVDNGELSFRGSLSNPWPRAEGTRAVFEPGKPYFRIPTSRLPSGSVILDNCPPGHVSVLNVPAEVLKEFAEKMGRFPK